MAIGLFGIANGQTSNRPPSTFGEFKGDGYYWYRQDPVPAPEKLDVPKAPVSAPASKVKPEPKALSSEWMRVNLPKLLDLAVDKPSPENVSNYMYAQRVLLDKAQNFSQSVKEVVATDPFLDENNRVPFAQFAQLQFTREADKNRDAVMEHVATKAGIWVFLDSPSKCSACEQYVANVLVGANGGIGLADKFRFNFKKIYINTPEGQAAAKRFNLKVTPTTVLVVPPSGYYLVSQGLMSKDTLQDRILLSAKVGGLLTPDMSEMINPYSKGVLKTNDINSGSVGNDASAIMKNMRQRIKGE